MLFLLKYYSRKLENLDIKKITFEHETALTESFYYAKEILDAENLLNWFIKYSDTFYRASFWQLISPMYEEILSILETNLGSEHPYVVNTLDIFGGILQRQGRLNEAEKMFRKYLKTWKAWTKKNLNQLV
ncbi:tetratricopeptide repeat protein [Methanosarcina horonobensis]|uniref:tetratricopeptide repeat protein n=1 Tax=Methanosarcina horonobensis TaxID=418008 RepID=UPI0022B9356C|nr:tetratricopeptide repeat protein [Methanosarcina horonobensis]